MYANVGYQPDEIECTLNNPTTASFNHTRNVKMLNFWSGNREVYSLSRSNKTLVLTGEEFEHGSTCTHGEPCNRMTCVRTMGLNGEPVTLSRLNFTPLNRTFRILSFGWRKISDNPAHYSWILQLEDNNL